YLASPGTLLEREADQLRVLAAAGLRVPKVLGYRPGGVLFTEYVRGVTLTELVAASPGRTADLLHLVRQELVPVLRSPDVVALVDRAPIVERSIPRDLPAEVQRHPRHGVLGGAVPPSATCSGRSFFVCVGPMPLSRSHHRDRSSSEISNRSMCCSRPMGGRPSFIDPGLMRNPPCADFAKLLSRLFLDLVACRPGGRTPSAWFWSRPRSIRTSRRRICPPRRRVRFCGSLSPCG
ncbi:hypothetical protein GTV15_06855, partial [Streptomyces sp. SID7803]|nr:hypothetical protein [Streptomyces sp. SID7803]